MPCHRCGARQTDPVRGASPWRRGVRAGEQVLICPDCQRGRDWTADLSRCAACGSSRLARALGRTECKDCGAEDRVVESAESVESVETTGSVESGTAGAVSSNTAGAVECPAAASDAALLAEQVQAALERQRQG
jgi:hypothetical protein